MIEENYNNKRKYNDVIQYEENIKKIKLDNDIIKLNEIISNISLNNNIKSLNSNKTLNFDYLIMITNSILNSDNKNDFITNNYITNNYITDDYIQEKIFYNISLMLYPEHLLTSYVFEENIYVCERNKKLSFICNDSKCYFPTWKKIYNYDFDYEFTNLHPIYKKICENFTKKIFNFYEKIHRKYFNTIIGNIFSSILNDYEIIVNPYNDNFNINIFNEWSSIFNNILVDCINLIKQIALEIKLEKIDELDQIELLEFIKKIKNDYIINLNKKKIEFSKIFEPLNKFYKKNDKFKFIENLNCLDNIEHEIIRIFKNKHCINLLKMNN